MEAYVSVASRADTHSSLLGVREDARHILHHRVVVHDAKNAGRRKETEAADEERVQEADLVN